MRRSRAVVVAIALAALAQPACGDEGPVREERLFGFILDVDDSRSPAVLLFDPAEWLTGDAADGAAAEDGVIAPGEEVPNDYYIRNPDLGEETVRLALEDDVEIVLTFWRGNPGDESLVDAETFAGFFDRGADEQDAMLQSFPYWLRVEGGVVVRIRQQYVP
jgi:hypothetical protein